MRTLSLNKTKLWKVTQLGVEEKVDSDGFFTGEFLKTYSVPSIVYINIYPANGDIVERIFGKDASFDMIAISNEELLLKDDLIFTSSPTSNYDETYSYKVDSVKKSLNVVNYGLKANV